MIRVVRPSLDALDAFVVPIASPPPPLSPPPLKFSITTSRPINMSKMSTIVDAVAMKSSQKKNDKKYEPLETLISSNSTENAINAVH